MKASSDTGARSGGVWGRGLERLRRAGRRVVAFLERHSRYGRLMRLHRPIGTWLLLWPTLWALWLAGEGRPAEWVFVVMVLGTIIVRSAGCVINDFADRDIDPHVERTRDRPLATGEVSPREALILFAVLMLIALALVLTLNRLAVLLAVFGALIAIVYPFAKRFVSAPQLILGVAFAWGAPMAFAAELGGIPPLGWLVFLAALIWTVVYDTEYAMVDRDDDLAIGVGSTAILFGKWDRAFIAALQSALLLCLWLIGRSAELGAWYAGGVLSCVGLMLYQQYLIKDRERERCFRAFLNNAWLGGTVFAGILLDYVFR
jgi:4-hydroxybenzoate polyprenyltransferase